MKHTIVLLIGFCVPFLLTAQQKDVSRTDQQWLSYYGQLKFARHWAMPADAGFRWKDGFKQRALYIVRAGIKRDLGAHASATVGVAHLGVYDADSISVEEYRPYQEIALEQRFGPTTFSQRFRVEERFLNARGDNPDRFNFRFRYSIALGVPVARLPALHPDSKLLLNIGNEVFLNAGEEIVYNVFDQNRLIMGMGIAVNNKLSFYLNYNRQYGAKNAPRAYRLDHIVWLSARHTVNL